MADAGVTLGTFPKNVDYLFLSHEHQDHLDVNALKHFRCDIPLLICRFVTPKFRDYIQKLGFTNIREMNPGEPTSIGNDVFATIFATAEYTNDSAILVEHDGVRLFNETDCKLAFGELEKVGHQGIDIGFYMFSGANWYPMMYDYPEDIMFELVRRRRKALLHSLVQRVKLTKPRFAVPAAGPCTLLAPDMLWLNDEKRGIFIDPELAVRELKQANLSSEPLYMAVTDVWDSEHGFEPHTPSSLRGPRHEYIRDASERMAPTINALRACEPPAVGDLPTRLVHHFNELVGAQTQFMRDRIAAKLALCVTGQQSGSWTVDFSERGPNFVREGVLRDWTYKLEVEDKLLAPFVSGEEPFLRICFCPFAFAALAVLTNITSRFTTFFMNLTRRNFTTGTQSAELRLADIPVDSLVRIQCNGSNLVVMRIQSGVFAYQDKCPHAFWPLSQGTLNEFTLQCPGHGWEFDVQTGRCLNAPAYCLAPVAVTVCGENVHLEWPEAEKEDGDSKNGERTTVEGVDAD